MYKVYLLVSNTYSFRKLMFHHIFSSQCHMQENNSLYKHMHKYIDCSNALIHSKVLLHHIFTCFNTFMRVIVIHRKILFNMNTCHKIFIAVNNMCSQLAFLHHINSCFNTFIGVIVINRSLVTDITKCVNVFITVIICTARSFY